MVESIYLSQLVPFGTTVDPHVCILIDCSTRSNPSWLGLGIIIPRCLLCHATFMPCRNLLLMPWYYCMITWLFIACCYVTCEYIIVLILAFYVARFWRGYIFYSSKKIDRVRMLGTSSPARASGVKPFQAVATNKTSASNILWSVSCLAGPVVHHNGLVNPFVALCAC